jgi:hypothetical protein
MTEMNMGKVRLSIMNKFNISDNEACHISNKDSHFFCAIRRVHTKSIFLMINALVSQTLGLSTSARRLTRCPCTSAPWLRAQWKTLTEVACEDCPLSECRFLHFLFNPATAYVTPFSNVCCFCPNVPFFAVLLPAHAIQSKEAFCSSPP